MKIKILGIPILEITKEPFECKPSPGGPTVNDPLCQPVKNSILPMTDGTDGGRVVGHKPGNDLEASTTCPDGPLVQKLKSTINSPAALAYEEHQAPPNAVITDNPQVHPKIIVQPESPARLECTLHALHTMSAQELLHVCNRQHKLDIDLVLNKFQVSEADILVSDFRLGTAGYRLREALRMRQHRNLKQEEPITTGNSGAVSKTFPTIQTREAEELKNLFGIPSSQLPRLSSGKLDMFASLQLLNITDPRSLWKITPPYGSALHLLKQVVGCKVGNGASVDFGNGITNVEVKEVL
jgi:hypothetical protein